MYISLGARRYDKVSNIKFSPEADVTGSSVPINEVTVDVVEIDAGRVWIGDWLLLYDDLDNLWCAYLLTNATWRDTYTITLTARSPIAALDTAMLEPKMYTGETAYECIYNLIWIAPASTSIPQELNSTRIFGYCPRQSARERLQWMLMVTGTYIKDFFRDGIEVCYVDDMEVATIPISDTYWKPTITSNPYVTAVRVTYYDYVEGMPSRTDDYVEADGRTWVITSQQMTLSNPDAPSEAPENVVEVDGVTIVNNGNVDEVATLLAKYYFDREEIDLSCIDNGQYYAGQRVFCFVEEGQMYSGYIRSTNFSFGVQAKADIHIAPTEARGSSSLTIIYSWNGKAVGRRDYTLPVGVDYELENPYVELAAAGHKYVFRPLRPIVSGRLTYAGQVVTEQVELALDYHGGDLYVRSVDSASLVSETAVIS